MIRSFCDKRTKEFAEGRFTKAFQGFEKQASRRLAILDAATSLVDLRQLNSNRLEALSGDRDGQYSIRVNEQWRICFRWPAGSDGPEDVEIIDYH